MAPSPWRACTAVAALLLSVVANLLLTNLSAAQQSTPPPALVAPELTAQAADDSIELTWTEVPGAARYELWSWTADGGWLQLGGDILTSTTYSHTGLAPGAAYYYQIRAISAADEVGVWSQQVSVSLPSHLPAPALTARASAGAIDLSWDAVDGAARYELWTWWGEDSGWQQIGGDNLTATSYSHTKSTPGVTYYYQMRAVDAAGVAGPWSRQASAVVTQEQPPDATLTPTASPPSVLSATPTPIASPSSTTVPAPAATPTATPPVPLLTHSLLVTGDAPPVLVARATNGAVELTWDQVTGAAYYDLRSWTEAGGWQNLGGENLTGAIFHHTGLTAGADYYYWIRTVDKLGGVGPWSERVSATLTAAQASAPAPTSTSTASPTATPTASPTEENFGEHTATPTPELPTSTPTATPTQLAASSEFTAPVLTASASIGAVELRWGPVAGAVRYILQSWTSPDDWQQLGGDNLTSTTFNHTGLTIGADYYYWVRAVNASGDMTDWSPRVDVTIPSARPPASTPTPTPTATRNETLNESPTPTPTASPTATNTATPAFAPTASPTPTPTPPSGPVYGFVRSSNITIIKDFPDLTLIWTPAPGAVHYNIYYCLSLSGGSSICREALYFKSVYELIGHELTVTTFLHENLPPPPPGQRYSHFYVVQACFRANCPILTSQSPTATPSPVATATPTETASATPTTTSATTAFSAPTLTAVAAEGAIELSWNAVTDAVRYELWYWTSSTGWLRIDQGDLTATSYTHTGLTAGTTYYYGVRAINASGVVSAWSDYPSVTLTSASAPTPTPTPSLTPTPTPTPSAGARVQPPPSSLNVHPYYRKYLDASGIPILSSSQVTDEELYQARTTILAMISDRPDLLQTMNEYRFRVLIYPDRFEKGGRLTDLPEFKGLDLSSRAVGAAGKTPYGWVSGSPEVARHCNHTLIHEFAHQIEDALRLQPGGTNFMARLNSAYQAAMLKGLWQDRYATTNALEYWAEIVRTWLTPSQFAGWLGPGYQKLEDYDPVGAALVADVLGNPTPLTFCEIRRFDLRGSVTLPGSQSSQPYTYIIQLSIRSPAGAKRLLGTSTAVSRSDGTFAFERLLVENVFLDAQGEKPHIVLGIYRYDNVGNAACPAAAFLVNDGTFARSTDPAQWKRLEVTGSHITGLSLTIPQGFDWTPLHTCI